MNAGRSRKPRPCAEDGCPIPASKGRRRCSWHTLLRLSIEDQEHAAAWRRENPKTKPDRAYLAQYPDWRWCSGCSWLVPRFYASGSRCKACERAAKRASHVERTYGISAAEERALLLWQGNRCFICGRRRRTRELAVDHDHETGAVRGLLCSDDRFGCNTALRRLLGDLAAAQRLVAYVEVNPLERMRRGDPAWLWVQPREAADDEPPPF